jgi:hypothetical protein
MINPAPRRMALAFAVVAASWMGPGTSAAPASIGGPPRPAVARLTALGFSAPSARRLLLAAETAPAGPAGAYAAQRIAMAVLYGSADAFGGRRYHPAE